jgi:hypothetical protein
MLFGNIISPDVLDNSVKKDSSLIEGAVIGTDHCRTVRRVPPYSYIFLVNFIPNFNLAIENENDFKNTLQFLNQSCTSFIMPWLEMVHHLKHKESVVLIFPGVEIDVPMLKTIVHTKVSRHTQGESECIKEVIEQELLVKLIHCFFGKCVHVC